MKYLKTSLLFLLATLIFIGCGGSSDSNSNTSTDSSSKTVLTGSFIDAPVQGLYYKTKTQEGFTDNNGTFKYIDGEEIEFKLGTLSLGSILANSNITPYTLGNSDSSNPSIKSKNIARVLQSLNSSSSVNKIVILDLSTVTFANMDFSLNNADLTSIINAVNSSLKTSFSLKSEDDALTSMNSYLYASIFEGYAEDKSGNPVSLQVFYNDNNPFINVKNTKDESNLLLAKISTNKLIAGDYSCTKSNYELVCNNFSLKPTSITPISTLSTLDGTYKTTDILNNIWSLIISNGAVTITNDNNSCSITGNISISDKTTLPKFTLTSNSSCSYNGTFAGFAELDTLYKTNDTLTLIVPNLQEISTSWTK